ncbi:MAG TPA: type IV pilus assembly protein PilM [Candidatus Paceibacterota bacterium]|nr:type IV pilus assembly protein PilM [Candidatus Paceibacterota bacterium]
MDNPFKKIFGGGAIFGKSGEDSAVGIDIGSSAIKVVEIKRRHGRAVLETYGSVSLGPYAGLEIGRLTNLPPEKISEALKEVMKEANVSSASVGLAIPVQASLIFTIALPPGIKDADIPAVVPNEARKYIPVPISEVSLDYFTLPERQESYEEANNPDRVTGAPHKEVLAVAIQKDSINKYHSIVAGSALAASFFEIEIFSSVRSNLEHELSLVLIIDFGASRTKLTLVEFGVVKAYHTINRGGAEITESISRSLSINFEEAENMKKEFGLFDNPNEKSLADIIRVHVDYMFSEANSVLLGYERKYGQTISKVILTGGGALLKGIKEVASSSFRAEIEIGRPFNKLESPEFLGKVLEATGPEFAVAIGLALRKLQGVR